ncbi:MAG: alpha/beta fold hydrolase [Gemmatimonadota bacterium]|nr:alpha/beta fold hydrolase [Gemmatimonadota bacterium]
MRDCGRRKRTGASAVLLVVAAVPAPALTAQADREPRPTLTEVTGELGEGRPYTFERGVLRVPQNRADPDGPVVELEFHRFPALPEADPDTPPIVRLNGGPGWPGFGGRLDDREWMAENILPLIRLADMVIVGQRGIGTSGPNTVCRRAPAPRAGEPFDREAALAAAYEAAVRCRERWESEGVDLSGFNVIEAATDVRDVVEALGYDRVQIHGGSFGSHWGMAVMRFHPDIVARAVLNGMEGPDHTYDMPGWVLAALERVAEDAESSGTLGDRVPEGGLIAGLRRVIERAEEEPIAVTVPRRRDTLRLELSADDLRALATGYTRASGHRMAAWPADMIRLAEGDFADAANAVLGNRFGLGALPWAAFFTLDCGSGISGPRLERLLSDPGAAVVGNLGGWYEALCPAWDADLGEDFRRNFDTDIPTVIVHGNWDLSTPLENALELRPHFLNHRFVLVERGTHGALGEAWRRSEAFREGLERFIATGDTSGLPDVVTLPPPDWTLPSEG